MKPVYVRTDKNGTKIYHDFTCQRCSGRGASEAWKFTGMTCYECGGSGVSKARIIREYTPEYAKKLEAKRQARWEKEQAKLRAEVDRINAEFLAEHFPEGKCYCIVSKDPWKLIKELEAEGVKYNNSLGYYFTKPTDKFLTVEIPFEKVTTFDYNNVLTFSSNAWKVIDAKIKDLRPVSKHIGEVGERITVQATYEKRAWYETKSFKGWGTDLVYIHTFVTPEGNQLVWKTSVGNLGIEEGESVQLTATVKEHGEYKGDKQTVLTRCKIMKGEG